MKLRFFALAPVVISLLLVGCNNSMPSAGSVQAATAYSDATVTGHYATALNGILPLSNGSFVYFGIMAHVASTGGGQFTGDYTAKYHNYYVYNSTQPSSPSAQPSATDRSRGEPTRLAALAMERPA